MGTQAELDGIGARLETQASEAFVVKAGETRRTGTSPLTIFGDTVCIKLDGKDTAGTHAIMECVSEPQKGPPLHRHSREDESFFVIESRFRFEVDGRLIDAEPGAFVFAPRGTAHTYQNIGDTTGRLLVTVEPAGLEAFFTELSLATQHMLEPDMGVVVPIFHKHHMELLGPPLSARGDRGTREN